MKNTIKALEYIGTVNVISKNQNVVNSVVDALNKGDAKVVKIDDRRQFQYNPININNINEWRELTTPTLKFKIRLGVLVLNVFVFTDGVGSYNEKFRAEILLPLFFIENIKPWIENSLYRTLAKEHEDYLQKVKNEWIKKKANEIYKS